MKPDRWRQIDKLFHAALERESTERTVFLTNECAGDEFLRREIESLLASHEHGGISLDACDLAADLIQEGQVRTVVGRMIGTYKILKPLGEGGMGGVFLAHDARLGREIALKLLPAEFTWNRDRLHRFEQEARAASALNHPNIVTIHEIGDDGDLHFIAMEFVDGVTLRERMARGRLNLGEALNVAIQVASALAAAHAARIVHRDIKPENILLRHDGYIKVVDFGLAKLTAPAVNSDAGTRARVETGAATVEGTPQYMSPEQVRGVTADCRTDIFSFGAVLYEMLTGQRAFQTATAAEAIDAVLKEEPPALPAEVPLPLQRIVARCLEKDPERRFQSAQDLAFALRVFAADSRRLHDIADTRIEIDDALAEKLRPKRRLRHVAWFLTAALVLCAVVLAGLSWWDRLHSIRTGRIDSVAVLPLENLSGGEEYFADGMTELLITHLGRIGSLRVISRPAVMGYKGTRKRPSEIAQELKVDAVVVGSVFRSGDRVRITWHLIDAATDSQLWSEVYEKDLQDVLALQSAVSRDIAAGIHIQLTPPEQARLSKIRRVHPEAYDLYLRAKFYASDLENKEKNEKAIKLLEQSLAVNPDFAEAQADLALACVIRSFLFAPDEPQWEDKSVLALQKAFALDPDLAEAHSARARFLWTPSQNFRHEEAIREFWRALNLNNNLDEAHHYLGFVYAHVGLLAEAIQECQTALEINPLNAGARYHLGQSYLWDGRLTQAHAAFDRLDPGFNPERTAYLRAQAFLDNGSPSEAARSLDEFLAKYPGYNGSLITSTQAMIVAIHGEREKAEELIARAQENKGFGHFHHAAYNIACAYALMKKPDQAVQWFEITVNEGFNCYPLFEKDSNLKNLRQDPRFVRIMAAERQKWEYYRSTFGAPSTWRSRLDGLRRKLGLEK
jgi:serine/threonine protein kinase/Flp pilus assembly protein TadD